MDYRILVRNLQLFIDQYFTECTMDYNRVIDVVEEIYHLVSTGDNLSFCKRIEQIIASLGNAMELRDEVKFIDTIEYELIPSLNQWRQT